MGADPVKNPVDRKSYPRINAPALEVADFLEVGKSVRINAPAFTH
jgi:hypothetical protein